MQWLPLLLHYSGAAVCSVDKTTKDRKIVNMLRSGKSIESVAEKFSLEKEKVEEIFKLADNLGYLDTSRPLPPFQESLFKYDTKNQYSNELKYHGFVNLLDEVHEGRFTAGNAPRGSILVYVKPVKEKGI